MASETTSIVIFGASGDLTRRKLVPALFHLSCKRRLPQDFRIVGFARSPYSDLSFRDRMWKGVEESGDLAERTEDWAEFSPRILFHIGDLSSREDMVRLNQALAEQEREHPAANRLFFLSIAPQLYEKAIVNLGKSGLAAEGNGWRRVVIEKPLWVGTWPRPRR